MFCMFIFVYVQLYSFCIVLATRNREIVFRVRVCVACVLACLRAGGLLLGSSWAAPGASWAAPEYQNVTNLGPQNTKA